MLETSDLNPKNFFAELKRRNVYKVAVAYAVVGWLVVQIATQVFPFFEVPNWSVRLIVLLIVVGFPIALVIAWAFELTPEGLKRTEAVDAISAPRSKHHAWIFVVIIAGALSLGLFFLGRYTAPKSGRWESPTKSIAVLPFESLSEDKNNAYFADGIQDEILAGLSKISDLKVISRTSTQKYKSAPANLRDIARQLGVSNILEGSVQKAADQVRVTVQLINAENDSHLWSETYDRRLIDIFSVETDVAEKIAASLQATLTGNEHKAVATKPTNNSAAYDAYLRGLDYERRSALSPEAFQNASHFYHQAVQLDPTFALAWTHLAMADSNLYFEAYDRTPGRSAAAQAATTTALRLQPDLGEAHLAQGFYYYYVQADYPAARNAFEEARKLLPGSAEALMAISFIDRRQGRWSETLAHQEQAIELDPRNALSFLNWGFTYLWMGRYADARAVLDRGLDLTPDDAELIVTKAASYQAEGDLAAAAKLLDPLPLQPADNTVFDTQILQFFYERRYEPAIAALKLALTKPAPTLGQAIGDYYALLGIVQERSGDVPGARATYTEAREKLEALLKTETNSAFLAADLALVYAGLRDKTAALRETQELAKLTSQDAALSPATEEILAKVQVQFGDADSVVAALPHLLQSPDSGFLSNTPLTPALLRLDPIWDPIRNDPRFQKLANAKP
jgi:TolB-like protein/Flp pilus assembly protein TadD